MMLLVSGALIARSLNRLLSVQPGFDPTHLLSLEINAVGPAYQTNAAVYAYHQRVRDAVRALPGVIDVATSNQLPLTGNLDMYGVVDPENVPANPELVTVVHDGDVVLMPQGYHPNVSAPGSSINFLWMMAAIREGDDRRFGVVNVQPEYAQGGSGLEASRK